MVNIMYKECVEILELLKKRLQQAIVGRTWMVNFVDYWIPIIGVVVLVITPLAAVYKYFKEKNRDLNEKILKEVYRNNTKFRKMEFSISRNFI